LCRFGAHLPDRLPPGPAPRTASGSGLGGLGTAVERAVARALETARSPVAVALSGGVDSTVIAAVARRLWGPSLRAFVLPTGSAPAQAAFVAERLGLTLETPAALPSPREVSPAEVARALGEPTHSAAPFAFLPFWRAIAAAGVGTVLTGDAADELFAGHAYHRDPPADLGGVSLWRAWARVRALGIDADVLLRRPGADWTHSEAARAVAAEVEVLPTAAERLRWLDVRLRMNAQCVALQARLTAATGLEYRAPFADAEVVSAALGLPVAPERPKAALLALAGALLGTPFTPVKQPVVALTGGPLSAGMQALTADALTREAGLFDPEVVARMRRVPVGAPYLPREMVVVATSHVLLGLENISHASCITAVEATASAP
jgi:asparagine synthase (glutamine-hydrolysing)